MCKYSRRRPYLVLLLVSTVSQAATIQVNTPLTESIEDGLCSISEAIIAANTDQIVDGCSAGQGEDTIFLEKQRYEMTKVDNFSDGPNGFPVIRSHITIQGKQFNDGEPSKQIFSWVRREISAANVEIPSFRFFHIVDNAVLQLKDIRFQNGSTNLFSSNDSNEYHGGAILNKGTLLLSHVFLQWNSSSDNGGGIYSTGNVVVGNNSWLMSNRSNNSGGGIAGYGTLLITESILEDNSAEFGGAISIKSTTQSPNSLSIINTVLTRNNAIRGGAIAIDSETNLKLLQTTIYKNTATKFAGGLYIKTSKATGVRKQYQSIIGNSLIAINGGGDCKIPASSPLSFTGNWFGDASCNSQALGDPGIFDTAFFLRSGNFSHSRSDSIISANSVLIDGGDDLICADPIIGNHDVLGGSRLVDGDGLMGAQCDIGAIERQKVPDSPFDTSEMFPFIEKITVNSQWKEHLIDQTAPDQFAKLVFFSPPTTNGTQQGVIRARSISGCCTAQLLAIIAPPPPLNSRFEMRFNEYTYLDQWHIQEQVSVLGTRPGIARAGNGETVIIGSFDLSGTRQWSHIQFPALKGNPAVFLSVQSTQGVQPVSVRVRNVTSQSFEAALFEEDALMTSGHVTEKIAYLLIYSPQNRGFLGIGERVLPYQLEQTTVDHRWTPVFNVELKLEEDQSVDDELFHIQETVNVIEIGEHIFAQQISDHGGDTTSLRIR